MSFYTEMYCTRKFGKGKYEYMTYERKTAKNEGTVQKLCWKPET